MIGLTATPYRMTTRHDLQPENGILNHVCYEVGVRELIVQGYLCPLEDQGRRQKVDTSGLHVRGGEFIADEVEALMDEDTLVQSACAEIVDRTQDRHAVLIFAAGVKHGEHVQRILGETRLECGFVCGETLPFERAERWQRFRAGKLKYLVNVNVLTTGFDAPNIDCVALLVRPTRRASTTRWSVADSGCIRAKTTAWCWTSAATSCGMARSTPSDQGSTPARRGASQGMPGVPGGDPRRLRQVPGVRLRVPAAGTAEARPTASTAGILSGQTEDTDYPVRDVHYPVHVKRDAPEDAPRTMRVDYQIGFNQ